jgi:hypothetical protein
MEVGWIQLAYDRLLASSHEHGNEPKMGNFLTG